MSSGAAAAPPDAGELSARQDGELRRDTLRTTASGMAVFALAFLTGPLLAQVLGPAGRGSVAAVVVPTMVLGWILMFGLPPSVAYYARVRDRRQLIMTTWAFAAMVGVPIVAIIWPFVPRLLEEHPPITVPFFRASLIAALLVLPFTATIDWLRGVGRNTEFNLYRLLQYVLNTVFLVVLFVSGSLTLKTALASALIANLIAWVTALSVNRSMPGRGFRRKVFKEQVNYGGRTWVGTFSTMVVARFDQVLMVGLVAPEALGLYVVAATAAQITSPIGQGVALSLLPHLRQRSKDTAKQSEMLGSAVKWTFIASASVAAMAVIAAPFLLPLVYGEPFRDAVIPLFLLLPGQICLDVSGPIMTKLHADNRPGAASMGAALGALITLIFVAPAVNIAGIQGAAVVTSISQAALLAYMWLAERRGRRRDLAAVTSSAEPREPRDSAAAHVEPPSTDSGDAEVSGRAALAAASRAESDGAPATTVAGDSGASTGEFDRPAVPSARGADIGPSLAGIVRLDTPAGEPAAYDRPADPVDPLFADPPAFAHAVNTLVDEFAAADIDQVIGIESGGLAVASAVAYRIGAGFVPMMQTTELPGEVLREPCRVLDTADSGDAQGDDVLAPGAEHDVRTLAVGASSIAPGHRVLIIDDVLETGATAAAATRLVERLGGDVVGLGFVLEVDRLGGRRTVAPRRVVSLVHT